jgi:DNA-directed RNA polymerase subunit alpha
LGRFELPKRLAKDEGSATETYSMFIAEPFEAGYGHTVGNSLRRVLLGSIEGAAISSVKIEGVDHEFQSIDGVEEDVTDIVLNLKKILICSHKRKVIKLTLDVEKEGQVTAGDIEPDADIEIVNPEQVICTIDKKRRIQADMEVRIGRGYCPGDDNKMEDQPIGVIAIDSLFSPVRLVKYTVENTRVGQMTDFDKLILEIWTDGRISPDEALKQSAAIIKHHLDVFDQMSDEIVENTRVGQMTDFDKLILEIWTDGRISPDEALKQSAAIIKHHLDVFDQMSDEIVEFETEQTGVSEEQNKLRNLLNMSVNEIELSVRAANCLNNANITTVGELSMKTEQEMLKYRNFGKKSLNEIKAKLEQLGLSLGMKIDERLLDVRTDM